MIYARSHRTIIDSWFLHCLEDTKANYSTMPSDLKIRHFGSNPNFGFPYLVFGLYFVLCGFCLGLLGSRKERKGKSPLRFCATAFTESAFCSACSATYSNDRVLLSVTPSALLLSLSVSLGFNEY